MSRILVVSDSHGVIEYMAQAVRDTMPEMVIHLGDCWPDGEKLRRLFPDLLIEQVPGNCDCRDEVHERLLIVEGKKIFICHGHDYCVKMSYTRFLQAALAKGADVALCGHTHRVCQDYYNGMAVLNPGTIGAQKLPNRPTYGIVEINGDKINTEIWCL